LIVDSPIGVADYYVYICVVLILGQNALSDWNIFSKNPIDSKASANYDAYLGRDRVVYVYEVYVLDIMQLIFEI